MISQRIIKVIFFFKLLGLTTLLLFSCENPLSVKIDPLPEDTTVVCSDTTFKSLETNFLIPLEVGNYWEYKVESLFDDDSIPLITDYVTHIVHSKKNIFLNCNIYESIIYDQKTGSNEQWLYWQDSTGYYSLGGISPSDTIFFKNLLFKYPVKVNEEWEYTGINYDPAIGKFIIQDSTYTYKCVATNRILSTPAGEFNCYTYYRRTEIADDVVGFFDIYEFLVPDVGYVGQEVFITIEELNDTINKLYGRATLSSYHLVK